MTQPDIAKLLHSAFPSKLATDVDAVLAVIPAALHPPSAPDRVVRIGEETVTVLGRIYSPEPTRSLDGLTILQREILFSLYTRHNDGFVRARHLAPLLAVDQPWLPPFVIRLLGEYVVEICALIAGGVDAMPRQTYVKFAGENPGYIGVTRQRVVSYWTCYYSAMPFEQYPGYRAMSALGLWDGPEARRLIMRPSADQKAG